MGRDQRNYVCDGLAPPWDGFWPFGVKQGMVSVSVVMVIGAVRRAARKRTNEAVRMVLTGAVRVEMPDTGWERRTDFMWIPELIEAHFWRGINR